MSRVPGGRRSPLVFLALAAIYVIWGSTYLAIRYAIQEIPPWLMAACRFATAGALMVAFSALKGEPRLAKEERSFAFRTGALFMLANATIGYVEKFLPSGIVAVVVGAMPIWVILMGQLFFGRGSLSSRKYLGSVIGLAGVGLIAYANQPVAAPGIQKYILLILILSGWCWAFGTQLQKNMGGSGSPFRYSGMQMIYGSLAVGAISLLSGELRALPLLRISARGCLAWGYLVVFGSVVAFTAFSYLAQNIEPHVLSSYALVNPVIAVGLGALLAGEPLSKRVMASAALILGGVYLLIAERDGPSPSRKASREKVSKSNVEYYRWGEKCDGWKLLQRGQLSVIQERMPPGAFEVRHLHERSRQFFFVLRGAVAIEISGERVQLAAHEGVEISPRVPHQVFNDSQDDVEFLLISNPPAQGDRVIVSDVKRGSEKVQA